MGFFVESELRPPKIYKKIVTLQIYNAPVRLCVTVRRLYAAQ